MRGASAAAVEGGPSRGRYQGPASPRVTTLSQVLADCGRPGLSAKQYSFVSSDSAALDSDLYVAGDLDLLKRPAIAVVGAREVSADGAKRARLIARELARAEITVVSGLAKGVDYNAHMAAIQAGGRTAAVIGTPLETAYPAANGWLQQEIAEDHLLVSPFAPGSRVFPGNFPRRNRVMAALTDGSVIIEASDSSGTLHQAAECQKLGRWLFILRSVFEDPTLKWPKAFASYERTQVVTAASDVIERVRAS